jgi:hypothetical protein
MTILSETGGCAFPVIRFMLAIIAENINPDAAEIKFIVYDIMTVSSRRVPS